MNANIMKIVRTSLIFLLVLGLLSSAFGGVVAAITDQSLAAATEKDNQQSKPDDKPNEFVSPTEQYGGSRDGEATLRDDVEMLSREDVEVLQKAFDYTEKISSWGSEYTRFHFKSEALIQLPEDLFPEEEEQPEELPPEQDDTQDSEPEELTPEEEELLEQKEQAKRQAEADAKKLLAEVVERAGRTSVIYLAADADSVFGGTRTFVVLGYSSSEYSETAYLNLREPEFEEVFQSVDICSSEMLTEENLVSASFAPGVSAYFGDATQVVSAANTGKATVSNLANTQAQIVPLGNKYSTEGGDLVVTLDYKLTGDKKNGVETELKLTGSFGIRDLQAHLVCHAEDNFDIQELYCGLSGQTFVNVGFNGEIKGEAQPEASELDLWFFSIEGLNEKRFPIAVFQFQGTTPIYITNQAFEASRESILPSLFVILYADWEGNISINLNTNLEYHNSFNSGLRIFREGELDLRFEEYPYPTDFEEPEEDGLNWTTTLTLQADTDLTLIGGSVLFYIAGVNLAEVGVARLGVEAQCNFTVTGGINQDLEVSGNTDAYAYIRGYLKLLEAKIKLKIDGGLLFNNLSADVDMQFCMLDLTLFVWGESPDKYKKQYPVSTMERPEEFASVMCLVCDISGSMGDWVDSGETKLEAAKQAAISVTNTTKTWGGQYEGNHGVGVVYFNDTASNLVLPHIDYQYIQDSINLLEHSGGTNIYTGIDAGIAQLEATKTDNKVIILMTDGQDSYTSTTLASAQAAADAGIVIYTIGFGSDVNEELLAQVAEITGGEYRYANTDNMMGVVGSFIYSQQTASGAEVLTEVESTVGEGEMSKKNNFTVKNESGDLIVTTAWPGSFLDTILVDPTGRVVDENYPGAVTDESQIPSTIVVKNPIPGKWYVRVLGVETSYEQEPFYTIVSFKETEADAINAKMDNLQKIAAVCLPVGVVVAITSAMLLIGLATPKKKEVQ